MNFTIRAFLDGTRRYGVPAPFSKKIKELFVMYIIINE